MSVKIVNNINYENGLQVYNDIIMLILKSGKISKIGMTVTDNGKMKKSVYDAIKRLSIWQKTATKQEGYDFSFEKKKP